jgi:hypothetical protein
MNISTQIDKDEEKTKERMGGWATSTWKVYPGCLRTLPEITGGAPLLASFRESLPSALAGPLAYTHLNKKSEGKGLQFSFYGVWVGNSGDH